ncbi:DUF6777 domain-containing protein [Streptomyces sp. 7R007]
MARPVSAAPVRRIAAIFVTLALALGLTAAACAPEAVAVAGESVGYIAESGFVRGAVASGERALARETLHKGGEYAGGTVGLYGGSLKRSTCDVRRLLTFLKNPANRKKSAAWAQILGLSPDRIGHFLLHEVTPVLLGNDTLVRNHGYDKRKGKANGYDSVLEAGMAVLVDIHGVPAVKCNCGNPLTTAKTDIDVKIKVEFKGSGKWRFDKKRMVKVKKSDVRRKSLVLADPDHPDADIVRQVGADGWAADRTVPATVTVPDLVGQSADAASEQLRQLGLQPVTEPDPESDQPEGTVTSTDPAADSTVAPGSTVTLRVAAASASPTAGADPSTDPSPDPDTSSTATGDVDGGNSGYGENGGDGGNGGDAGNSGAPAADGTSTDGT